VDQRSALGDQTSLALAQRLTLIEARSALVEGRIITIGQAVEHLQSRHVVPLDDNYIGTMTPKGWMVLPAEEHRSLIALSDGRHEHEPGTVAMLEALLLPGDVAVDAGAHVGLLTVPMARRVGPTGRVIAAEPMPRSAGALRRSLAVNGLLDRVELHQAAIHHTIGRMLLHLGENAMLASLFPADQEYGAIEVNTTTIDVLVGPERKAAVVKLDVEGAELDALDGMRRTVAANPDIVVIAEFGPSHLNRARISVERWLAGFTSLGLTEAFEIDEASRLCAKLRSVAALSAVFSLDLLFARPGNQRLRLLPGIAEAIVP
jgi:FkbM family methyltransferase